MNKKIKIVFAGGGTGGHLFPIIAIARELRRLDPSANLKLSYISPRDPKGQFLLSQEDIKIQSIPPAKFRRYFSLQNVADALFGFPAGLVKSFFIMLFSRPRLVFSKGGTGSLAVTLAARTLGIPVFIHESDSVAGSSNRITAGWAKKTFVSFPKTTGLPVKNFHTTGTPILKELQEGTLEGAKEIFGLALQKPVLLFWGGSQGAQPLNDFILNALPDLVEEYEVIHVCGAKNFPKVQQEADVILQKNQQDSYHVWEFLDEIPLKHALKAANFIISRAGSGSIFEIAAAGKPSILVPLPSAAHNHQSSNAYQYANTGAAIVMEQDNLNKHLLLEKLAQYLGDPVGLAQMQQAALAFAKPLAAKAIAREILEFIQISHV